jgi:hypothetical protein
MALTPDQIDDFVNLTLKLFKRRQWTDFSLEHQFYTSAKMLQEKKVVERGGEQISFRIKTRNTGNARNSGMFAQDVTKVEDVTVSAQVPWAMQTTNFSYDIYEDLFQSDKETIIKELQIREHDAMMDMAELNEENLWTAPTGSTDSRPMGIPFWIQKDNSSSEGAFNGGNPSGFTGGCAGVDSSAYPRWKNWAFGYSAVSRDDLVRKVKRAITFTDFQPPVPHPELGYGLGNDFEIYTTYRVQEPLERLAENRNDNLGSDVATYMNRVTIGGVPLKWVPYLESNDTSDPLYGVNWNVLRPFVKQNCDMRRNPPKEAARQHSVREVHVDHWMNYICYNRRKTFVGSLTS